MAFVGKIDARILEGRVRREYGDVRRMTWDACNKWAEDLSDRDLLAAVKLAIPDDAGIAATSEARRRHLIG